MTKLKMTDLVKSGLCEALKWRIDDQTIAVKVPLGAQTKELRTGLLERAGEPATTYFNKAGNATACQWFLPLKEWRVLWSFASPVLP